MKNFTTLFFCTFLSLLLSTNLSGKIAIIGYDSGGSPDEFSFVSDELISAGTIIYFSEDEYDAANDQFLIVEGLISYVVPTGGLPAGRVVVIQETGSNLFTSDDGGIVTRFGTSNFSLSGTDEEITAFSASNPASPHTTATLVYCWFIIAGTGGPGSNEDPSLDLPVEITINYSSQMSSAEYARDRSLATTLTDIQTAANWNFNITSYPVSSIDFTGPFTLDLALPVELTEFNVKQKDDETVMLEWATASEEQNEGFQIERSVDGKNWEKLGFVLGRGTSSEQNHYHYEDGNIKPNIYYYRLRQIDFDGGFSFSPVKNITISRADDLLNISVFPNPVKGGNLMVSISDLEVKKGEAQLIDLFGRVVLQESFNDTNLLLKTENVPVGVYWLTIVVERNYWHQQVIVQ